MTLEESYEILENYYQNIYGMYAYHPGRVRPPPVLHGFHLHQSVFELKQAFPDSYNLYNFPKRTDFQLKFRYFSEMKYPCREFHHQY